MAFCAKTNGGPNHKRLLLVRFGPTKPVLDVIVEILHLMWIHRTGLPFWSALAQLDLTPSSVLLFVHHGQ